MGMLSQLLTEVNDGGTKFVDGLKWLVVVLVSIAGSLCILYAIYIGYLFATATDDGKRRAAKDRLIKVLSSLLIIFALAMCLTVIDVKFTTPKQDGGKTDEGTSLDDLQSVEVGDFYYSVAIGAWFLSPYYGQSNAGLTLRPENLKVRGGSKINDFDSSKVKFTDLSLVGLPAAFINKATAEISTDSGILILNFTPPNQVEAPQESVLLPWYYKDGDNKNKYWQANVRFTHDSVPYTVVISFAVTSEYWYFESKPSAKFL